MKIRSGDLIWSSSVVHKLQQQRRFDVIVTPDGPLQLPVIQYLLYHCN